MSKKKLSNEQKIRRFIRQRLTDSRNRANSKGWDFDLDAEFLLALLNQSGGRCPITKKKFILEAKNQMNFSIDRYDNSKGYTKNNVWLISTWANKAKGMLSYDEFKEYCASVVEDT